MSHGSIAAVFAGTAVLALLLVVRVVRDALANHDIDGSALLAFGTAAFFVLPSAVAAITGELRRRPDVFGNLTVIDPSWYHRLGQLGLACLVGLVGWLVWRQARSDTIYVHAAGLLAIALWAVAHLSSGLQGGKLITARAAVLFVCLVGATVLPRGRGAAVGVGVFGVVLAAAGGLLSLFRYDVAFVVPCEGACSELGFTGVLPNENLLGIALLASIPFAYLGFRGRARFWLCIYLAAMAAATGSRTATAGALISLGALLVVRPRLDVQSQIPRWRIRIAWAVLGGVVAGSVYIVRHHWSSTALTFRPEIWGVAWSYIRRSPWFGYGPEAWASLYQAGKIRVFDQRTTFNQWTDVLFVAGTVGAALLVGMALAAIVSSGRARAGVLLILATILMIGVADGAWEIGAVDILSFSLVAFILTGESSRLPVTGPPRVARLQVPVTTRARPRPRRIAHESSPKL